MKTNTNIRTKDKNNRVKESITKGQRNAIITEKETTGLRNPKPTGQWSTITAEQRNTLTQKIGFNKDRTKICHGNLLIPMLTIVLYS